MSCLTGHRLLGQILPGACFGHFCTFPLKVLGQQDWCASVVFFFLHTKKGERGWGKAE